MEKSLFQRFVTRYFGGVALRLTNLINDKKLPNTYLYREMLRPKFSATLKWNTLTVKGRAIMADVVSLDSPFPLKKRGSISRAEGDVPKIATKRSLNETQMTDIMILEADPSGDNSVEIAKILFEDTTAVVIGVEERIEYQFLQGLSSGVFSVANETEDENGNRLTNIGIEYRVDLMHPEDHKFGAAIPWSNPDATVVDDIERINTFARSKGDRLTNIYMDTATFNKFKRNTQLRTYLAGLQGSVVAGTNLPIPSLALINEFLGGEEYGARISIIDRTVTAERDGKDVVLTCWTPNAVVFTTGTIVGDYVYGKLAAERFPNKNVDYQKIGLFTLVSKYQKLGDTPLEFTTSQARVIPVVDMSDIYIMDCEEAQDTTATIQTEGDATITIYGSTNVNRQSLINALKALGVKVAANITDPTLVKKVNELNDEDEMALKFALEIPIVEAGDDQAITVNNTALAGEATPGGNNTISSTVWSKLSGGAATITTPNALQTTVTGLVAGTYVFKLTVTDSAGLVTADTVTVNVNL